MTGMDLEGNGLDLIPVFAWMDRGKQLKLQGKQLKLQSISPYINT
jgi:hypothetical protein